MWKERVGVGEAGMLSELLGYVSEENLKYPLAIFRINSYDIIQWGHSCDRGGRRLILLTKLESQKSILK